MNVIPTEIPDVLVIEPKVFGDERGFFFESFNQKEWEEMTGLKTAFVGSRSGMRRFLNRVWDDVML